MSKARERIQARREARASKRQSSDADTGGGNFGGNGLTKPPYTVSAGETGPRGPYASGVIPGVPPYSTIPSPSVPQPVLNLPTTPQRWANEADGTTTTGDELMPKPSGNPGDGRTDPPYRVSNGETGPWGPGASGVVPGLRVTPTQPLPPPPRYAPDDAMSLERKASAPDGTLIMGDKLMPKPADE